jgi:3-phenylpropionate/trans-cinnamate dioxygenase ferredoxin reductase subunit
MAAERHAGALIVGGGLAGASCAEALRERGFDGSVLLVGREPQPPYERPPCSKDLLRGESQPEDALLHPEAWYAEHEIELLTRTSVMKLDAGERTATLSTKDSVRFDRALLATGANVRRLRVDGGDLEGIHYLRALGNAASIRRDAESAERVVLIGGSYIACEVAASLTALGKRCTLVMMEEAPLSTGFGAAAGRFFAGLLGEHGIELVTADPLARFEGDTQTASPSGRPGRVQRVITESGRVVDADLVVLGTGALPDVMLARAAGLELGDSGGVRCSASLETSAPGVWAAGDPCEYDSVVHRRWLRVEHFEVAAAQGRYAAAAMLGEAGPYEEVPYFWSDLADWCTLEYVGPAERWDREVVRGSFEDGSFTTFYLDGGRVAAALTVGRSDDLEHAKRLITARTELGDRADALADESTDLAALD